MIYMEEMRTSMETAGLMLIVPHQDDEILMAAGVLRRAVKAQIPVKVVMATNGDYGCKDFSVGRARLRESREGLALLGLSGEQFEILGYADTGMPEQDSFLTHLYFEKDEDKIYSSACGVETYGLDEQQESCMRRHGKHASYCRRQFKQDLKEILMAERPSCIITTSEYDLHGDHSALYRFICEVLDELKEEQQYQPFLYTGMVHSNAGDENWPARNTAQYDCPAGFEEETGLLWKDRISVPVPEEMRFSNGEKNLKYQALLKYETALEPNAYEFLMAFIKEEELFWKMRG